MTHLEIADRHAAGVDQDVRQDDPAAREQLPVGLKCHRAVGGFDDQLRADARGVGGGDLALQSGRHENIALRLKDRCAVLDETRAGKIPEAARTGAVPGERLGIEAVVGKKGAVILDDADEAHAFFLDKEFRRVVADIAEALDDHPLAFEAAVQARHGDVVRMAEKLADDILDAAAGRFGAARDAALGYRLAGHAGNRVDVRGIELPVFVRHPGHLACAGSHVRRGHVAARADIAAVGELLGEAAGDPLELFRVVVSGADRQPALGAAERHVDERAFEGHQRRQRFDLLLVDMGRVANAALHGKAVLAVHRAPAAECVVAPRRRTGKRN